MMAAAVVGIDIGTTSVKAGLCRLDGSFAGLATAALHLERGVDGAVSQDLDQVYGVVAETVRGLMASRPAGAGPVLAMAVTGQMAGVGLVDAAHRPVAAYDSWLDTRCAAVLDGLDPELAAAIEAKSGCAPTISAGPKLAWWAGRRSDAVSTAAKAVTLAGYVAGKAVGLAGEEAIIDPTYLHFVSVADTAKGRWERELADGLGVPWRWLPRIVPCEQVIGQLTPDAAALFGLPSGLPVAAGCGDTAAAAVGAGVLRPGQAFDVAGTAAVFGVRLGAFAADPGGTLLTMRMPLDQLTPAGAKPSPDAGAECVALGYVGGGGELIDWLTRVVFGHDRLDQAAYADLAAAGARARADAGLLISPHFSGRVCPAAPAMRGAVIGLTPAHGRPELARAAMEAVAFEYRGYLEAALALTAPAVSVAPTESPVPAASVGSSGSPVPTAPTAPSASPASTTHATSVPPSLARPGQGGDAGDPGPGGGEVIGMGGGAQLSFWNQLKADVLAMPYRPLVEPDSGVRGIAAVAAAAVGETMPPPPAEAYGPVAQPRPNEALEARFADYQRWMDVLARQFETTGP